MDMALASGTAHGHVGQLTSTPVFERVGDVHGGTLRSVGGDGVRVGKFVAPRGPLAPCATYCPQESEQREICVPWSTEVTTARCEVTHAPPCPGAKVMTRSPAR